MTAIVVRAVGFRWVVEEVPARGDEYAWESKDTAILFAEFLGEARGVPVYVEPERETPTKVVNQMLKEMCA